jgi:hypothetical protein
MRTQDFSDKTTERTTQSQHIDDTKHVPSAREAEGDDTRIKATAAETARFFIAWMPSILSDRCAKREGRTGLRFAGAKASTETVAASKAKTVESTLILLFRDLLKQVVQTMQVWWANDGSGRINLRVTSLGTASRKARHEPKQIA